jgi:AraC family transcriptional regulator
MDEKPASKASRLLRDGRRSRDPNVFHGGLLRDGNLGSLRVTEVAYPPGLDVATHAHQHAYLGITVRGASVQWCGTQTRLSQAWTVTYHPPQEIHRDHFEPSGALGLNVEFMPGFLERLALPPSLLERGIHSSEGDTAWLAARLYREFLQADEPAVASVEGLTLELLAHLWRGRSSSLPGNPPLWLQRIKELLRTHFSERLSLFDLSAWAGIHPVHLARTFRKFQGCTVGDYIRRLRVEHACREISQKHPPLADVALSSGFCDQSQFCKTFRNLTGMTPREYQEAVQRVNLKQRS